MSITLLVCEMSVVVRYCEHSLALPFFGTGMKTDLFEGSHHYLRNLHHSLASGQATRREHSPAHQQKINKETQTLNDTMDQLDLIGIYRTFHPQK